jgi:hypothetical protein
MGNVYLLSDFMARSKHKKADRLARDLTNRQREIAALVRERHSNKVIAKNSDLAKAQSKLICTQYIRVSAFEIEPVSGDHAAGLSSGLSSLLLPLLLRERAGT